MNKYNLLECTLRDGGYITNWVFDREMVKDTIKTLIDASLDYVEVGYLNNAAVDKNKTLFKTIDEIEEIIPTERKHTMLLAMADVDQFLPEDLTPFTGKSIDGIRVVFYKRQIDKALTLCKKINEMGYKLFVQPMVTIDYSVDEYCELINRIKEYNPFAVSIVDSFGYMLKDDFRKYFKILDNSLDEGTMIGFHSHNNMNLAFITAQDIFDYKTARKVVIDASLYGMGRGAGNLQTELIANYYNMELGKKYDLSKITYLIGEYILPIYREHIWGYSPYYLLTGLYKCHPNYAGYLLSEYDVTVSEFESFIKTIPEEMKTNCKKPYVLEKYLKWSNQ